MNTLKLGLIGDNIDASGAPRLHEAAGRSLGRETRYDRLVPARLGLDFEQTLELARRSGLRGVNVTLPYKERAATLVEVPDPLVRRIGAVNTVLFKADRMEGWNTDHSGFIAAWRRNIGGQAGSVCLLGAGGVGRAVAFGLVALGADALRVFDRDAAKARRLAEDLVSVGNGCAVTLHETAAEAGDGASGLINCTPAGMVGYGGTALAPPFPATARWAFDAVYTPIETPFVQDARAGGLQVMTGYELFFWQGLHAVELFHGRPFAEDALRDALA
jgi:shikimate dehydrogenase